MTKTHRAVIETSVPPGMEVIAAGDLGFCERSLSDWVASHPLGEYERGLIMEVAVIRDPDRVIGPGPDPDEFVATEEELVAAVEDAKREILDDLCVARSSNSHHVMPLSISSFSQLHDYVDANEYAGLCDDDRRSHWVHATPSVNALQDRVDEWLARGEHRVEKIAMWLYANVYTTMAPAYSDTPWRELTDTFRERWRAVARQMIGDLFAPEGWSCGAVGRPWLTLGELRARTAHLPEETPITAHTPDGGWWYNVELDDSSIPKTHPPEGDDQPSIILGTRDDFDTRQW